MAKTLLIPLLPFLAMHIPLRGNAQNIHQKITLEFNNISLSNAFRQLQITSGIPFTYSPDLVAGYTTGHISRSEKTLSEWIALFLRNRPFSYQYVPGNAGNIVISPQPQQTPEIKDTLYYTISGYIRDSAGLPVEGASVYLSDQRRGLVSDSNGFFSISHILPNKSIQINAIGYLPYRRAITGNARLQIVLQRMENKPLDTIAVSTGYQQLNKDRTTGSFAVMNNQLVNRNILPNILDRLEGMMSSLQFIKNIPVASGANESTLSIRGRSTINSNPQPLVIMDNFPYDGDLSNINPNDIESVTLLKDAASASIWGAFSGNGVIVFNTKKGKYFQKPQVSLYTNYTLSAEPNLYYSPALSSPDYIEIETFLMNHGYYNALTPSQVISPAVEIMYKAQKGLISSLDSATSMQQLAATDTRTDLGKYFYRPAFNQQYSLGLSGGTQNDNYYISASFNKNLQEPKRNSIDRYTLFAANTWRIPQAKLEIYTAASLSQSLTRNNNDNTLLAWPYLQLADTNGKALSTPYDYSRIYTDTAGDGKLLDWSYRPLDQLNNSNHTIRLNESRFNIQARYHLFKPLQLSVSYQYSNIEKWDQNYYSMAMYETRNLINTYSQIVPATGMVTSAVPSGGIMQEGKLTTNTYNTRFMAQWQPWLGKNHSLFSIAGYEVRIADIKTTAIRKYGYNYVLQTETPVDYTITYPTWFGGPPVAIPQLNFRQKENNNYLSWFVNNNYVYRNRYFVSASLRKDESNLFGVNINNKGIPLWSAGLGWMISNESFYPQRAWVEQLKIRAAIGYTGNVNTSLSAFNTATASKTTNRFSSLTAAIVNPANPNLGWEKVRITNLGLDFSMLKKRIQGSVEVYKKDASELIGPASPDPTTGVVTYTGNAAKTESRGMDISINALPVNRAIKWNITILFSYNTDKVTYYPRKQPAISNFLRNGQLNPAEGKPLYSLYSLPYMGLTDQGNPIGRLNGLPTTDYMSIFNSFNMQDLIYNGPANPTFIGSSIQNISWKQFTLSALFIFKAGYFFRRPGINYTAIIADNSAGHPEYRQRWKKPGDERVTIIPSLTYPFNNSRDDLYALSNALIERGDHLRLQDIKLTWQFRRKKIQLYGYVNNIGILWRANHSGIDPDNVPYGSNHVLVHPATTSYTAGINFNF